MLGIKILGSGAGGGFPQWNCLCDNCRLCRLGKFNGKSRTQSSIAITTDQKSWILINASPDLRQQLMANPEFHPTERARSSPIKAVILVDAQIDHTSGLLLLREGQKLPVYCTQAVEEDLRTGYPVLRMLEHYCGVTVNTVFADGEQSFRVESFTHLKFLAVPLVGKAPPYSPHREHPQVGDNIGLLIVDESTGKQVFYAPALERVPDSIIPLLNSVDLVLVDGTFWTSDEMIQLGFSQKRAEDMGHMPVSGNSGILSFLQQFSKPRKILIHINNTNPILDESSSEFQTVRSQGVEVAQDGWMITL